MTLERFLLILREQKWLIVLAVIVGLAGSLAVFLAKPAEYTATTQLYVSAQSGANPQQAYQGAQLSQERVKSYIELTTSPAVLDEVQTNLRLPYSSSTLAGRVTATNASNSVIISVNATDTDAHQAATVADAVSQTLVDVVGELERPQVPNAVAPVAVRIIRAAKVPTSPSSSGLASTVLVGMAVGVVVGVGGALLRSSLDRTVKTSDRLRELIPAPCLGQLPLSSKAQEQPLVPSSNTSSPEAEAYRALRTSFQFLDVDADRKVIVITSSLPGEGKSTTSANLAVAMGRAGSRVLLIEADLRRPRVAAILGLDGSVGLTTLVTGRSSLEETVQRVGSGGFDLLASGPLPPNPSELLGSRQMRAWLDSARAAYDVVLIDSPPSLPVTDAAAVASSADGVVLLCRYGSTTMAQLVAAKESLDTASAKILGTVLTMVPTNTPATRDRYTAYQSFDRTRTFHSLAMFNQPRSVQPTPSGRERALKPPQADQPATDTRSTRTPALASNGHADSNALSALTTPTHRAGASQKRKPSPTPQPRSGSDGN